MSKIHFGVKIIMNKGRGRREKKGLRIATGRKELHGTGSCDSKTVSKGEKKGGKKNSRMTYLGHNQKKKDIAFHTER